MSFLSQSIQSLVQPVSDFASVTTDETLTSALSQLTSSHDAILVFHDDDPNRLAGIIRTPQQGTAISQASQAKVENNLTTTPRLSPESTIQEALESMNALRVNLLPLRNDDDGVDGIITVASILNHLSQDQQTLSLVSNQLQPQTPIAAPSSANVGQVMELMNTHNISRVILTTDTQALAGIVSRRDLTDAFTQPSDRQRFSTRNGSPHSPTFDGEKVSRSQDPITSYAVTKVVTANDHSSITQAIKPILEGQSSSVVLTGSTQQPTGFLSRQDILNALLQLKSQDRHPVIFRHPDVDLSDQEKANLEKIAQTWASKLAPRLPFDQITVSYEANKSGVGQVTAIETVVKVDPSTSSQPLVAKNTSRSWNEGLRQALDTIDSQLNRRS